MRQLCRTWIKNQSGLEVGDDGPGRRTTFSDFKPEYQKFMRSNKEYPSHPVLLAALAVLSHKTRRQICATVLVSLCSPHAQVRSGACAHSKQQLQIFCCNTTFCFCSGVFFRSIKRPSTCSFHPPTSRSTSWRTSPSRTCTSASCPSITTTRQSNCLGVLLLLRRSPPIRRCCRRVCCLCRLLQVVHLPRRLPV